MKCRRAGLALALVIVVAMLFAPFVGEAQPAGKVTWIGYLALYEPPSLLGRADEVIQ